MDEIHRFNRAQQDAFLPHVETGLIVLIGATTENPSFEVNSALLSRCRVYVLRPLGDERCARSEERPGPRGADAGRIDPGARRWTEAAWSALLAFADGDARRLLNLLEVACATCPGGAAAITADELERLIQRGWPSRHGGEDHFDWISALHKSLRGSDPHAGLYWLARMLEAGEDPKFIVRRLIVFASEDVGLADPGALVYSRGRDAGGRLRRDAGVLSRPAPTGPLPGAGAEEQLALRLLRSGAGTGPGAGRAAGAAADPQRSDPADEGSRLRRRAIAIPHDAPGRWVPESYLPEEISAESDSTGLPRRDERRGWWRITGGGRETSTACARRSRARGASPLDRDRRAVG